MTQTLVVIAVETVNIAVLCTNNTILDIIMNFLALVVITEFDDFFFMTVEKEMMADLIKDSEFKLLYGDRFLCDVLKYDRSSGFAARGF